MNDQGENTQKLYQVIVDLKIKLDTATQRLQTYALDIENAEKALNMKGIALEAGVSVAHGIEKLYEKLTTQYAHEGGTPQVMTQDILADWLKALSVPMAFDIYHAGVNVFYVGFSRTLYPDDIRQIEALGFTVVYANSQLRNRYMLKWNTPKDDER